MRPPGGELTYYTVFGMFFSVGAIIAGFTQASPAYYFLAALIGLPSLGVWLEQRWAGLVLAIICALTIPLALMALIYHDDTLLQRGVRVVRILIGVHFAFVAYQWSQGD